LYRIEKGIVRSELAKLIGISEMTMDRVEHNKEMISNETIKKVEKILKFDKER
jgi:transcriptional regulator with XRE-family HTH domain